MITQRAKEIHGMLVAARKAGVSGGTRLYERKLLDEIIESCDPTDEEFDLLVNGVALTAGGLFRLIKRFGHG